MEPSTTAAVLLLFGATLGPGPADAHAPAASVATKAVPRSTSAFAQLSPGSQKVALALHNAQPKSPTPHGAKPMSLEAIAAMRQRAASWTRVFQHMKDRGLIQERNLTQVVSRDDSPFAAAATPVATSPRAYPKTRPAYSGAADTRHDTGYSASYSGDNAQSPGVAAAD